VKGKRFFLSLLTFLPVFYLFVVFGFGIGEGALPFTFILLPFTLNNDILLKEVIQEKTTAYSLSVCLFG